jgi:hypothetical protein
MPIATQTSSTSSIDLDEFVAAIERKVRPGDVDSIVGLSEDLRRLANNPRLLLEPLQKLATGWDSEGPEQRGSTQGIALAEGASYFVRAMVWPIAADVAAGRAFVETGFEQAHDHNYDLLTIPHIGPGYTTEIFEFDPAHVAGIVGEKVELRALGRHSVTPGTTMLYRASRDVHTQELPPELTVTINVMIHNPDAHRDQYLFNPPTGEIIGYPSFQASSRLAALLGIASSFNTEALRGKIRTIAQSHPSTRTRWDATCALAAAAPGEAAAIWEQAAEDRNPTIKAQARRRLEELRGG